MSRFFNDLKKYSKYVKYSAKSSLKSEVAGSYLGWIWWVLEPVLFMLVYWFIFSVIFSNKTQYFPIFIFIGLSMWNFFNKGLNDAVLIVKNNVATISKVYLPKQMFMVSDMLTLLFKMGISFVIVFGMMIAYRVPVTINVLWLIPVLLTFVLLSYGLNCIIAHFGVFVEDLKKVIAILLRILMYMSGVFYELVSRTSGKSKLKEPLATIMTKFNPIAFLMNCARDCLIYSSPVHYKYLAVWFVIAVIVSIIGTRLVYKYENSYVKVI